GTGPIFGRTFRWIRGVIRICTSFPASMAMSRTSFLMAPMARPAETGLTRILSVGRTSDKANQKAKGKRQMAKVLRLREWRHPHRVADRRGYRRGTFAICLLPFAF